MKLGSDHTESEKTARHSSLTTLLTPIPQPATNSRERVWFVHDYHIDRVSGLFRAQLMT